MSLESEDFAVTDSELIARFIVSSKWFRRDQTVRQDAFIPHPHPDLSVTRHKSFSENEIWNVGQEIANKRPATLYGRADISVEDVRKQKLVVEARPVPDNVNHASIVGWPLGKPAQKILALELAASSHFVPKLV